MIKEEHHILPVTPGLEPGIDLLTPPVSSLIFLCNWRDRGEHYLCSSSLNLSLQNLEVPFDCPCALVPSLISANLNNYEWVIVIGLYQTRDFPSDTSHPGPRQAVDFHVRWVQSAYQALCSLQKGITYDNDPPFFLSRGSRKTCG